MCTGPPPGWSRLSAEADFLSYNLNSASWNTRHGFGPAWQFEQRSQQHRDMIAAPSFAATGGLPVSHSALAGLRVGVPAQPPPWHLQVELEGPWSPVPVTTPRTTPPIAYPGTGVIQTQLEVASAASALGGPGGPSSWSRLSSSCSTIPEPFHIVQYL